MRLQWRYPDMHPCICVRVCVYVRVYAWRAGCGASPLSCFSTMVMIRLPSLDAGVSGSPGGIRTWGEYAAHCSWMWCRRTGGKCPPNVTSKLPGKWSNKNFRISELGKCATYEANIGTLQPSGVPGPSNPGVLLDLSLLHCIAGMFTTQQWSSSRHA